MIIVSCDSCARKYKITDVSRISNLNAKFRCKHCGKTFSINTQLARIENRAAKPSNTIPPSGLKTDSPDTSTPHSYSFNATETNLIFELFKKLTLRKKFTLALAGIMFFSVLGTFSISDFIFRKGAEHQITNNARFLLATIEASRSFTGKIVKPALYKELPNKFVVEAMSSSFGARNIFERIKQKYPEYYFKHASLNPRNKLNLADKFESDIIQKFRANPRLEEWQGYRDLNGNKDFIIMKPIVADNSCMKCHSVPSLAPREMIERYGDKAGFGMVPGETIGALSISVPASKIFTIAKNDAIIVNFIVCVCFIILIVIINLFFQQIVVKPIERLKMVVEEISVGKTNIGIEAKGSDEINDLARGFERMRISVNLAMSRLR